MKTAVLPALANACAAAIVVASGLGVMRAEAAPPVTATVEFSASEIVLVDMFNEAGAMLVEDGSIPPIFFLLRDGEVFGAGQIPAADPSALEAGIRGLAGIIEEQRADGLVFISEQWGAVVDRANPVPATEAPNRFEVLSATLVEKTGRRLTLTADIVRSAGGVALGSVEANDRQWPILAPVYRALGRAAPVEGAMPLVAESDPGPVARVFGRRPFP